MTSLSAHAVAAIEDLELAARLVVEGLRAGMHRSPFHGYSAEFQQHRPYRAGDDLKHLDWKLLGRTDRLYSRQFRETTNMSVMLVLDASASMAFPESEPTKFRYASVVAAALAYLIVTSGDAVGLIAGDSYLPARGGRPHLSRLIAAIDRLQPQGEWQPTVTLGRAANLLKRRGLIVVISDFYDDESGVQRELRRLRRYGHDAALLQVIDPAERTLPALRSVEVEDAESGARLLIDARLAAATHQEGHAAFLARVSANARREGIDHALLSTDQPPERALREFLLARGTPA